MESLKQQEEINKCLSQEKETLQTTNSGFMSQITQLRTEIRKKSQAVDDMKTCIESLREEKSHLTSLRDNLELNLENKESIIVQLKQNLQEVRDTHFEIQKNLDEEKNHLGLKVSELENYLQEQNNTTSNLQIKVSVIVFHPHITIRFMLFYIKRI